MGSQTRREESAEAPESPEASLACLNAAFEDGDPDSIALALNRAARAKGLAQGPLNAQSDLASMIRALSALGLQLSVKPA